MAPSVATSEGTFKMVGKTVQADTGFKLTLAANQTNEDFLIARFKPTNFNPQDIYEEFKLYEIFGNLGISPKIYAVIKDGRQNSLHRFLINTDASSITPDIQYIVEKFICDNEILSYFSSYTDFFIKLRELLRFVVSNGYYNTDIKVPNLCVELDAAGKVSQFKMIDLDPKFVKPIEDSDNDSHYINYMIYQVYIYLTICANKSIHLSQTGIDKRGFDGLIKFIVNKNISNSRAATDDFDPVYMLFWYSKNFNKYNTRGNIKDLGKFLQDTVIRAIGVVTAPTSPAIVSRAPPVVPSPAMGLFGRSILNLFQGFFGRGKKSKRNKSSKKNRVRKIKNRKTRGRK